MCSLLDSQPEGKIKSAINTLSQGSINQLRPWAYCSQDAGYEG